MQFHRHIESLNDSIFYDIQMDINDPMYADRGVYMCTVIYRPKRWVMLKSTFLYNVNTSRDHCKTRYHKQTLLRVESSSSSKIGGKTVVPTIKLMAFEPFETVFGAFNGNIKYKVCLDLVFNFKRFYRRLSFQLRGIKRPTPLPPITCF